MQKISGDHLYRTQIIDDIITVIASCVKMKQPVCFSIEGEWGRGKSWIVQHVVKKLKGYDLSIECSKNSALRDICNEYIVFNYNAWEKDYYAEPLLGILLTMVNQLNEVLKLENFLKAELKVLYAEIKDILEKVLGAISLKMIGVNVVDVGKRGLGIFTQIKKKQDIKLSSATNSNVEEDIGLVVNTLNRLSKRIPIVFIVDELDRCLPEHAIKTLERLHHVFSKINSSVTIVAVNEKQLKNSVIQMFGKDISFDTYLRKFIDFRINIDNGTVDGDELKKKLQEYKGFFSDRGNESIFDDVLGGIFRTLNAREIERVCSNAMLCHRLVDVDTRNFEYDYMVAELFLFAHKIVSEKEGNSSNLSPIYGNRATTNGGQFIKTFLTDAKNRRVINVTDSKSVIFYIAVIVLDLQTHGAMNLQIEESEGLNDIINYFNKYKKFYKMIRI